MQENELFTIDTEYKIYYSNKNFIPIDEIIKSLKSLESNIHYTSKFIEQAYPNSKVVDSEIFIENLQSGSLDVKLLIRKSLKAIKNNSNKIVSLTPSKETVQDIVKQTAIALIIEGSKLAISTTPATAVTNNQNLVIHNLTIIQPEALSQEDYLSALEKIPKKTLAENAINITKPAKLEDHAEIKFISPNEKEIVLDREILDSIPENYTPPTQDERTVFHKDVELSIYASDKDRREQGWAGSVHSISHNRITLKFNENVKPELLHGKTKVTASIMIHEKFNPQKINLIFLILKF